MVILGDPRDMEPRWSSVLANGSLPFLTRPFSSNETIRSRLVGYCIRLRLLVGSWAGMKASQDAEEDDRRGCLSSELGEFVHVAKEIVRF